MTARRLRNAGRRIIAPVRRALTATVLVAGLALMSGPGCKPKEQPKKPVPAAKAPEAKCRPCPIDPSKLSSRTMMMDVQKNTPIMLVDQEAVYRDLARAMKKKQKTFSPGTAFISLGTVTKIDGRGLELSLNLKSSKKVRINLYSPQCVAFGPVSIAVYAEKTEKGDTLLRITYPQEIFPKK